MPDEFGYRKIAEEDQGRTRDVTIEEDLAAKKIGIAKLSKDRNGQKALVKPLSTLRARTGSN